MTSPEYAAKQQKLAFEQQIKKEQLIEQQDYHLDL